MHEKVDGGGRPLHDIQNQLNTTQAVTLVCDRTCLQRLSPQVHDKVELKWKPSPELHSSENGRNWNDLETSYELVDFSQKGNHQHGDPLLCFSSTLVASSPPAFGRSQLMLLGMQALYLEPSPGAKPPGAASSTHPLGEGAASGSRDQNSSAAE